MITTFLKLVKVAFLLTSADQMPMVDFTGLPTPDKLKNKKQLELEKSKTKVMDPDEDPSHPFQKTKVIKDKMDASTMELLKRFCGQLTKDLFATRPKDSKMNAVVLYDDIIESMVAHIKEIIAVLGEQENKNRKSSPPRSSLKSAEVLTSPSEDCPPLGINQEALPIWKRTLVNYAGIIFNGSSDKKSWATAISIFEKSCKSRKVSPWKAS